MTKNSRLNIRVDDYTDLLIKSLVDKTSEDKSKVIRTAIEYYANYVLGQEEVFNIRLYQHFNK